MGRVRVGNLKPPRRNRPILRSSSAAIAAWPLAGEMGLDRRREDEDGGFRSHANGARRYPSFAAFLEVQAASLELRI